MKYPDKKVEECLKAFALYSEDDLIIKMQKTNPECADHIAAKILFNEKENKETDKRHKEAIEESRQANTLSRWAIFIAILSLIFAIIALFDKKQTGSKETLKLESQMPTSSSGQPYNSKLPIQQEKGSKDK